jgi:type VI secretion system protein ImpH
MRVMERAGKGITMNQAEFHDNPIIATSSGDATDTAAANALPAQVAAEPWRYEFGQALRVLALEARRRGLPLRDGLPVSLRFRTPASLAFPASELIAASESDATGGDAQQLSLTVGFLGLTGPSGALPTRYTELLVDRKNHHRDSTLHDFLDLFSHRAIALFYAASQKYRVYRQVELDAGAGFSRYLLDLAGAGLSGLRGRLQLTCAPGDADRFLMYYAGILARRPLSAAALEGLVAGLLGVGVRLQQFQPTCVELPPSERSALGLGNCELGVSALIGSRLYDRQSRATLMIGPLNSKTFADLLPGSTAARALAELIRFCIGHTLAVDVSLTLRRKCIPAPHLSAKMPRQLGFNTWIRTQPLAGDRDDCRYVLQG